MCSIVPWTKRTLLVDGKRQFMTCLHLEILDYLMQHADQYGDVFMDLSHFDTRVLNRLCKRDLLVKSVGPDGRKHKITSRGRRYFYIYRDTPPPRSDGLCPDCGERPTNASGYCQPCSTRKRREWVNANRYHIPVCKQKICKDCRKAKSVQASRCYPCFRAYKRGRLQAYRDRHADNPPLCTHCGERPRKVYATTLCGYCEPCRAKLRLEKSAREKKLRLNRVMRNR